jgi:hypothetical protein
VGGGNEAGTCEEDRREYRKDLPERKNPRGFFFPVFLYKNQLCSSPYYERRLRHKKMKGETPW